MLQMAMSAFCVFHFKLIFIQYLHAYLLILSVSEVNDSILFMASRCWAGLIEVTHILNCKRPNIKMPKLNLKAD